MDPFDEMWEAENSSDLELEVSEYDSEPPEFDEMDDPYED